MQRRLIVRAADGGLRKDYERVNRDGSTKLEIEGDFEFEVEDIDTDAYVQVQYTSGWTSYSYTYRDPSRSLKVGDLVEVRTTTSEIPQFARVVALGRGSWTGPVKDVEHKLIRSQTFRANKRRSEAEAVRPTSPKLRARRRDFSGGVSRPLPSNLRRPY